MDWLLILLSIVGLALVAYLWLTRPRPRCPECKSYDVVILKKDPDGFGHASYGGGGSGGGWVGTRIYYQVTFRCQQCGSTWTRRITETG